MDERREQGGHGPVTVTRATSDYDPRKALLPWCHRIPFQIGYLILISIAPAAMGSCVYAGLQIGTTLLGGGGVVRLSCLVAACAMSIELVVTCGKTEVDTAYLTSKPVMWVVLLLVWTTSLSASEGKLGMHAFTVFGVAWFCRFLYSSLGILVYTFS